MKSRASSTRDERALVLFSSLHEKSIDLKDFCVEFPEQGVSTASLQHTYFRAIAMDLVGVSKLDTSPVARAYGPRKQIIFLATAAKQSNSLDLKAISVSVLIPPHAQEYLRKVGRYMKCARYCYTY